MNCPYFINPKTFAGNSRAFWFKKMMVKTGNVAANLTSLLKLIMPLFFKNCNGVAC
jgi:hypothetical protein